MSDILDRRERAILENNGSKTVTIPAEWVRFLGIDDVDKVNVALVDGKHGLFFAAWPEDQRTIDNVKEETAEEL